MDGTAASSTPANKGPKILDRNVERFILDKLTALENTLENLEKAGGFDVNKRNAKLGKKKPERV